MTSLKLKKFDPSKMGDDKVCVVIGKRGTGKSSLVTDILWYKKHMPVGVVMSATEDGNHHYKQFVPDLFVHSHFDVKVVEGIIERQKKLIQSGRTEGADAFLLLDDCMYDSKFFRETVIRLIFLNGRHWKLFCMVTLQYCMGLSPDLRANVDYVFILRENIRANRERLWKSFAGIFPKFDQFSDALDACTENYECMVIDNTSKSNNIEDCVYWYKARLRSGFKIGSAKMWATHAKKYKSSGHGDKPRMEKKRTLEVSKLKIK